MKNSRIARAFYAALILVILAALISPPSLCAEEKTGDDQIVFLHLQIDSTGVTLIDAQPVPGKLKIPRAVSAAKDVYFEAADKSGEVFYSGALDDPLVRRLEYEDPDHPGQLRSKTVYLEKAEFTIRVPGNLNIENISFYRPGRGADIATKKAAGQFIGTVRITPDTGGER